MAFLVGFVAASSLILGAGAGLIWKPGPRVVASIMAFGAGILIAALAFELVEEATQRAGFFPMAAGFILGGIIFIGMNKFLNSRGAFGRKKATLKKYIGDRKRQKADELLDRLSKIEILRNLPPEEISTIISEVELIEVKSGTVIFREGEEADGLYLIDKGEVEIVGTMHAEDDKPQEDSGDAIAVLGEGDAFGEMALVMNERRTATVKCKNDAVLFRLKKEAFNKAIMASPLLSMEVGKLLARRLNSSNLRRVEAERERRRWKEIALRNVDSTAVTPIGVDVKSAVARSAPLAIWLGILLDGIPESAVLGASIETGKMVSLSLFAGIFLSNIPEALSSAIGMLKGGHNKKRIILMWGSLVIFSGICAMLGNLICSSSANEVIVAIVQGIGAGAILTMVAETMLPEAFEQGGSVVGISTLLGFLSAYMLNRLF